jgi:TPR repeat protein
VRHSDGVPRPVPDSPSLEDVRSIRAAAKTGDVQAQYRLGSFFRHGRHGSRNYVEAVKWYRKAAEQKDARAQRALGDLYRDGQGVPEDWTEAATWYRRAAEQGDASAQANVGLLYHYGQGVTQDYVEAAKWHRKAAEQGNACAQRALGHLCREGKGVPRDCAEAVKWFQRAADQGDADAQLDLGTLYRDGQGVPQNYAEAARWFKKAADQGSVGAQRSLACLYDNGQGVPQDHAEAAQWFRKAAEQGDAHAQVNLGLFYKLGLGVQCDYAEAAAWYWKAADQGVAHAQVNLGLLYHHGLGVPQDHAEAATWYWRAADQGDAGAQRALGVLYRDGKGVVQDYVEAARWFRKAAEQGDAHAQCFLGDLYGKGEGVAQDYLEAARWYRKATDRLGPLATEALERLKAGAPPLALALLELEELPGLAQVKATARQLADHVKVGQMRRERGLKVRPLPRHCAFSGPPGTEMATVARLLGRMLKGMGALSTGTLVEVDRAGLVAEDEGQTAPKVHRAIERALGGILFIDEADSLAPEGQVDACGREAIDALAKGMESHRDELVVVITACDDRMQELLDSNPGLRSCFRWHFRFQDHEPMNLVDLFVRFAHADGLEVDSECLDGVKRLCQEAHARHGPGLGSERFVRQLFESTVLKQSSRLASLHDVSDEALQTLLREDLAPS